jgi:hypothetical protein
LKERHWVKHILAGDLIVKEHQGGWQTLLIWFSKSQLRLKFCSVINVVNETGEICERKNEMESLAQERLEARALALHQIRGDFEHFLAGHGGADLIS